MNRGHQQPVWSTSGAAIAALSPASIVSRARACLIAERDRWALWLPVLMGSGIAFYFSLPFEPPLVLGIGLLAAAVAGFTVACLRRADAWAAVSALVMAAAFGLILVGIATLRAEAPVLSHATVLSGLTGRITAVEPFPDGSRIRLEDLSLEGHYGHVALPEAVRIKLRRDSPRPHAGQWVKVTARLSPPPRPSYPGAFDFARNAWFDRLGGVGFAYSHWQDVPAVRPLTHWERLAGGTERFRNKIASRLRSAEPDISGHVLAALLTGDRSGVPEPVLEDLRRSGLAHLLAISGLHIGMVAAIVFVTIRFLLALREGWARDHPIKKWAAAVALLASFGYLILSGATIPTQRAFLMTGLVLIAVLTDRLAISMRLVAVAAATVLVLSPESIVGASFQLSFAAVIALVAVYEQIRRHAMYPSLQGPHGKILTYLGAVCLTTVIAGAATAPFAIYHFGQVAHYSVLANLIAVPIVTFLVMPLGLLSLVAMPFGLEALPAMGAGWGIDGVLWIARWVADLPGAVGQVPAMPDWGLALVVGGGLWCAIWLRRWRYLGLPLIVIGILSPFWMPTPILILHEEGEQSAIVWNDALWVEAARKERFAQNVWSEKTAFPIAGDWSDLANREGAPIRCDPLGCATALTLKSGNTVSAAFSRDPRTLLEDCALSDLVRLPVVPHPSRCRDTLAIDPAMLRRNGAHAIFGRSTGLVAISVESRRGERPWTH